MSSPRDPGAQGAAPGTGHESKADEPASSKERAAVAQTLPSEALMPTLPPEASAASMRSARGPAGKSAAAKQEEVQFAVTLGPDGPIDPHAATLRPGGDVDPYGETLSPSRRSAALADTLAPEDLATGSTLGPESASSLPERSLDGVVSVGDMSRLQSDYPVARWDRYEFQKKLGQGGMGAVYKARDRRLGRDVALKFIRGGDPNMVMRFLQEARAQARIDHPNVCKVYEVGEVEGKAYIAMQYVDGQSLNRAAKGLSLTEKVLLMRQVAEAMHEAHRLGIIHRDLKPDNIMVERLTDGTLSPVVMDFGLARESGDNRGLTESGAVMGTPAYMAPEQARGDVRTLDRRADVYSLGATLYDLVAGVPPFDAESVVDVLMQVMNEDAVPLRNRLPSVPGDLETIVMKCLRKEPGARYDSAKALADDLQRYIDGEPIQGRRESVIGRVRRRAKKHVALVAVSAGSLVLVISFAVQWVRVQITARRERERAAELVKLERQLGQDIKEMEWFLRSAYQLPLHDITPQLAIVRSRMANMESQRAALRGDDGGRIDYAIGRGHLALHEPAEALRYLQAAKKRGLDIPELHYALGRALGERFQQALEEARRQGDKSWVEKRRKELEAEYLQPAVQELEKSRGGSLDSPEYLEGLIAFYRKQYDVAQSKVRKTIESSPWLYDAQILEGDIFLNRANEKKDRGEYDAAIVEIKNATSAYKLAIDVGRSDAVAIDSYANAEIRHIEILREQNQNAESNLAEVLKSAEQIISCNPRVSFGYVKKAYGLFWRGFAKGMSGGDPREDLLQATKVASKAIETNANDAYAFDMLGNASLWYGQSEMEHERNPDEWLKKAQTALMRATEIDVNFPWANSDLGLVFRAMGEIKIKRSQDPIPEFLTAVSWFKKAISIDEYYMNAYGNAIDSLSTLAAVAVNSGSDPDKYGKMADAMYESSMKINKNFIGLSQPMANIGYADAVFSLYSPDGVNGRLDRLIHHSQRMIEAGVPYGYIMMARSLLIKSEIILSKKEDPSDVIKKCRLILNQALASSQGKALILSLLAETGIVLDLWIRSQGRAKTQALDESIDYSRRAILENPSFPEAVMTMADALWRTALAKGKSSTLAQLLDAQNWAERAVGLNPMSVYGYVVQAGVLALLAQRQSEATKQAALRQQAEAALRRAEQINPRLGQRPRISQQLAEIRARMR
jgi:tetratricopeptide (TPR) repeat protein/tRNA A-37 threonylcarbamoyl transferase component Bud32